jgi:hypothetical protein
MHYIVSMYSLDAKTDSEDDVARRQYRYDYTMKRVHELQMEGNHVYSPILHCHELSKRFKTPPEYSHHKENDRHMVDLSEGLIVLDMISSQGKNWRHSEGMSDEIQHAKLQGKSVIFLDCKDHYDKLADEK